jgi:hypothetical protein
MPKRELLEGVITMNVRAFAVTVLAGTSAVFSLSGVANADGIPKWAETGRCMDSDKFVCAIGISDEMSSQEDARSAAWTNALIAMARRHLPFLQSVRESSEETLRSATFKRAAQLNTEEVDWSQIEEDTDSSSPYLKPTKGSRWVAYVLLRWSRTAVDAEVKRLKDLSSRERAARVISQVPIGDTSAGVGQLHVNTVPAGATIVVAGYTVGTSNAVINGVGKGVHQIIVKLPGYETVLDSVSVRPGQTITRNFKLTKLTKQIEIRSSPEEAVVFLNNRVADFKTGGLATFDYGIHSLRVEKPGYFPESRVINVDEQLESIEFKLQPMPGFITVLSDVKNATVEIDGRPAGTTDVINLWIKGGDHTVRVFKPGYEDFETNVYVTGTGSKAVIAKLTYLGGNSASASSKKRQTITTKSTLATLGTALAVGVMMTLNQKQSNVNRSSCDSLVAATSKSKCHDNADAMDKTIKAGNEQRTKDAAILGLGAVLCFGISFKL